MNNIESLRSSLPDAVKDTRLNLQSVFVSSSLSNDQKWGVALAVAYVLRDDRMVHAVLGEAGESLSSGVKEDAKAAASLMAMNNVYYRFRHLIGKEVYSTKPAKLRMSRMSSPSTTKVDFELMCLAVSAVNGCGVCMSSHEEVVLKGGLTDEHVHDAVRIAAVLSAGVVSLGMT